jgi:hypothetical protein
MRARNNRGNLMKRLLHVIRRLLRASNECTNCYTCSLGKNFEKTLNTSKV